MISSNFVLSKVGLSDSMELFGERVTPQKELFDNLEKTLAEIVNSKRPLAMSTVVNAKRSIIRGRPTDTFRGQAHSGGRAPSIHVDDYNARVMFICFFLELFLFHLPTLIVWGSNCGSHAIVIIFGK